MRYDWTNCTGTVEACVAQLASVTARPPQRWLCAARLCATIDLEAYAGADVLPDPSLPPHNVCVCVCMAPCAPEGSAPIHSTSVTKTHMAYL